MKCRNCNSDSLIKTVSLGEQYLTGVFPKDKNQKITKGPLDLIFCKKCSLLQLGQNYDLDEMYDQANEIASWGESVFVKIPITNSKGKKTSGLIKKLLENKIKCNVTAILTTQQVKEIYEISNFETEVIISIFAGRIADTGIDPIPMMTEAVSLCKSKKNIEILWASTRELINIFQANKIGCQIITVPHDILKKISLVGKNLDDLSLEIVQMFLDDATKAGFKIKINK